MAQTQQGKPRISNIVVTLFVCAMLLLLPGLYNGFPLVTSDSGAYIGNGYTLQMPLDRPLTYSLFIRVFSCAISVWGAVFAQAILLAFFLYLLARHFLGKAYQDYIFVAVIALVTAGTSAAWFCSQLMPDIFTAILFLAAAVWYMVPIPVRWQRIALGIFIYLVLLQHNSHALILLLFAAITLVNKLITRRPDARKSVPLILLSLASLLTFSTLNKIADKGFRPSAGTNIFLMSRLVESGVMDKFLAENCNGDQYSLCAYRDHLPNRQWTFMWDTVGALYKTGGWIANDAEYGRIEKKILTTPKYLGLFVFKSMAATCRQLPQIYIGDGLVPMDNTSSVYNNLNCYRRNELKEFTASLQNIPGQPSGLPFGLFSGLIIVVSFVLGICVLLLWGSYKDAGWIRIFRMIFLFLVCNAMVTATFSTVLGRFESRVFWILPFFCMLYLIQYFYYRYKHLSDDIVYPA